MKPFLIFPFSICCCRDVWAFVKYMHCLFSSELVRSCILIQPQDVAHNFNSLKFGSSLSAYFIRPRSSSPRSHRFRSELCMMVNIRSCWECKTLKGHIFHMFIEPTFHGPFLLIFRIRRKNQYASDANQNSPSTGTVLYARMPAIRRYHTDLYKVNWTLKETKLTDWLD